MRRIAARPYVTSLLIVLVGLTSLYFGDFRAATIEPVSTIVGAVFVLFGIYSLFGALRSRKIHRATTPGEVGAAWPARLARDMRVYYTKRSTRFRNPASLREFDRQMLSLFDSIEAGSDDIDAKIEKLRSYVGQEGLFQRLRDQNSASIVWRKGDDSLPWVAETWQLRTNWTRLRLLGPTWAKYTTAAAWVTPADWPTPRR
jgi:hypothetical protein